MIRFFNEGVKFNLPHKQEVKKWLSHIALTEGKKIGALSVIFCSDEHLLQLNRRYLQHDYYTDIITFEYTEGGVVSGDLFISLDTVRANAGAYSQPFEVELRRVMAQGLLHLCGYDDTKPRKQKIMRAAEDRYLNVII